MKQITGEDRIRLYYNLVHARRQIIDANILRKPQDQGGNFFVSTLRRSVQTWWSQFSLSLSWCPKDIFGELCYAVVKAYNLVLHIYFI